MNDRFRYDTAYFEERSKKRWGKRWLATKIDKYRPLLAEGFRIVWGKEDEQKKQKRKEDVQKKRKPKEEEQKEQKKGKPKEVDLLDPYINVGYQGFGLNIHDGDVVTLREPYYGLDICDLSLLVPLSTEELLLMAG